MNLTTFLIALFALPGFFSFLIVQTFTIGFAKKSSAFEKTYYSLLFDIPIFLITLKILNGNFVIDLIDSKEKPYDGFTTIEQFIIQFNNDIDRIFILSIIVLISSISIGFVWIILIKIVSKINNLFRKSKLTYYNNLWKSIFVKSHDSIPIEVYNLEEDKLITQGFLQEVSSSLERDIEFKVYNVELFEECLKEGIIKDIEFVYLNQDKNLKVVVYNQDEIIKIYEEHKGKEKGGESWVRRMKITISTKSMKLMKGLLKKIQQK
ncbi:hypothetical protein [Oceanobacillus picturae]|uniref:hypothetical protein n=1 Tax=Oceanobacillus picturae TaxID=171693 RepID=UPI00362AAB55